MNIKVHIYDNRNGVTFDVSEVVSDITITTYLEDNPGKLEFTVLKTDPLTFAEGATVSVVLDGHNMFKGFVFKRSHTQDVHKVKVTCYDQLRYLKNKDSRVFENVTSSQIFEQLCKDFVLNYKTVDASPYICAPRSEDATSLYDMIKNALNDTLANTNIWYFIRDNFGTLEHLNITSCVRPEMLGDKSFVTGFDYETSIDSDVYNQIKLYRDNETTGKREVFIVNDTINGGEKIRRWGILQLYEKIDEKYNIAQIESRALRMLKYYGETRQSLTLKCLGVKEFFAGCIFKCQIAQLGDTSLNSYLLVTECTHKISNELHTMDLKTEVVRV
jgi:hypothetical protein